MKSVAIFSFVLFITSSIEADAQRPVDFEFGIRAGVPFTKPLELTVTPSPGFTDTFSMEKPGFTAGPTFGVVLYDRLVVQFDALYKPIQFVDQVTTPVATFALRTSGGLWEFPLVFDYRFFKRAVRPYGGGGIVLGQTVFGTVESRGAFTTTGAPIKSISGFGGLARQFSCIRRECGLGLVDVSPCRTAGGSIHPLGLIERQSDTKAKRNRFLSRTFTDPTPQVIAITTPLLT